MTTEKQIVANQTNAQASTGPKTAEGKATVSTNPIKHGIFVAYPLPGESESDYHELLDNLKSSFMPQNQMESLLVEKIAIDFWRLRRVLRFEAGCIQQYLESLFQKFYEFPRKSNPQLTEQTERYKKEIDWIKKYIVCLTNDQVDFDHPVWQGDSLESTITEDFYLLARHLPTLSYQEKGDLPYNDYTKLKAIIERHGYTSKALISSRLKELYLNELQSIEQEIESIKNKQLENDAADKLHHNLGSLPVADHSEKVLKYERSLQKSICENLFLLKKLQGVF